MRSWRFLLVVLGLGVITPVIFATVYAAAPSPLKGGTLDKAAPPTGLQTKIWGKTGDGDHFSHPCGGMHPEPPFMGISPLSITNIPGGGCTRAIGDIGSYQTAEHNYVVLSGYLERLFYIFNVDDPYNPTVESFVPLPAGGTATTSIFGFKQGDNYYVSTTLRGSGTGCGFFIHNVTDPTNPVFTSRTVGADWCSPHEHFVSTDSNGNADYAWVSMGNETGSLWKGVALNLSNISVPVETGRYQRPDANGDNYVHDFTVVGNRVFLAHWSGGLIIQDKQTLATTINPTPLNPVDSIRPAGFRVHHSWPTTDGNYVFVEDELLSGATQEKVKLYNITDINNPQFVSGMVGPGNSQTSEAHNLKIISQSPGHDLLLVGWYRSGLRGFDVDTTGPTPVLTHTLTHQIIQNPGPGFGGAWGVDYQPCTLNGQPRICLYTSEYVPSYGLVADALGYDITLDRYKPESVITDPVASQTITACTYTISGTAHDYFSGMAQVEVSTDDGATWNLAQGTENWTYEWNIPSDGSYSLKVRATDLAGNVETPGAATTVTVTASCVEPTPTEASPTPTKVPPTPTIACGFTWDVGGSLDPGTNNALNAVAVVSANDIWAVGWKRIDDLYVGSLVEHWNGAQWSVIGSPSPDQYVSLNGIDAISADDIWAVGTRGSAEGYTFSIHWDGTKWTDVPTVNLSNQVNGFSAVAAISSNEVWAVGYYQSQLQPTKTLVERWDGTSWSVVQSPSPHSNYNTLTDITAINDNPDDIWAVGYTGPTDTGSLAMHWDGIQWSVLATPNSASRNYLYGISGVSSDDVWAVGYTDEGSPPYQTSIMHWDGTKWTALPGTPEGILYKVKAISANDVWAVGEQYIAPVYRTFVTHWNGATWDTVPSPNAGTFDDTLVGLAVASASDIWAVGAYHTGGPNSPQQTLVERYHNPCTTPTPTITATSTNTPVPATSTSTPLPPTSTATACSISFTDVPSGSTFYAFVQCLACRDILGGYTDGTFRPGNNITRAQLSKIVANSAKFNDAVTGQSFADVLPSNTFYLYIGRMASRGIIGGYPCGGPNEPCGPGNMPYFRPNANATRGQISKIVSEAKGFNDIPEGRTFEDVPATNTFYVWIERLASRGIMSGYPCGGEGETCGSGNLPYFRPNNNATRGQVSKIVSNTFFPNCQTP